MDDINEKIHRRKFGWLYSPDLSSVITASNDYDNAADVIAILQQHGME